jgi:hypothetical protein
VEGSKRAVPQREALSPHLRYRRCGTVRPRSRPPCSPSRPLTYLYMCIDIMQIASRRASSYPSSTMPVGSPLTPLLTLYYGAYLFLRCYVLC